MGGAMGWNVTGLGFTALSTTTKPAIFWHIVAVFRAVLVCGLLRQRVVFSIYALQAHTIRMLDTFAIAATDRDAFSPSRAVLDFT
jgi:hypothetical protein